MRHSIKHLLTQCSRVVVLIVAIFSMVVSASSQEANVEPVDSTEYSKESVVLDDLVVTARKKLINVDAEKVSYNAAEDPDANSMTALDMLRRVPMVSVDAQDKIAVNGKNDFKIYVDGKPNAVLSANPGQLLKTIPASSIERFEVINNPGANYDAEGVGGILNIIMKSAGNLDGYTATISGTFSPQALYGNIYGMMQHDKLSVTANVSVMRYAQPEMTMNQYRENTSDGSQLVNLDRMKTQFNSFGSSLNLNWKPNAANMFSVSGNFSRSPYRIYNNGSVEMIDGASVSVYGYDMASRSRMRSVGVNAGADYSHIFADNDRHRLDLSYRFNINPSNIWSDNYFYMSDEKFGFDVPENYFTSNRTDMMENIGQADYSYPLGEKHLFSVGSKLTLRRSTSDAPDLNYKHHSTVAAAYLTYGLAVGNFSLKAGTRYEYTHQSARYESGDFDPYKADYNNFVPTLTLNYNFAPVRSLSAGYNMRISRPGIGMLNPYVDTTTPLVVKSGNPLLRPEKYNKLTLAWSAMWGKLMFNAQADYSFCNDGVTQITTMKDGVTYQTYSNSLRSRQANISMFLSYNPCINTRIMLNSTTTYSSLRSPLSGLANHGWEENYMLSVQQTLPWKLQFSANIFGQTGRTQLQGSMNDVFAHMFSLTRAFCNDRLNVSLTAVNPFDGSTSICMREWGTGMNNVTDFKINMRTVQLAISYRFGDLKQRQNQPRQLESDLLAPQSSGVGTGVPGVGPN